MRKPRSPKSATPTTYVPMASGGVNIRGITENGLPPFDGYVMAIIQVYPLPKGNEQMLIGLFEAMRDAAQKYLAEAKITDGTMVDVLR